MSPESSPRSPREIADRRSTQICWLAVGASTVGWTVLWWLHSFRSNYLTLATAVQDDTFYYLLPAWNFSRLGWFTFDGLTYTYGFQPLWEVCLAVLATASPSRETFLRMTLFLAAICYAVTALGTARAARALWRSTSEAGGTWAAIVGAAALLVNTPVQTSNMTGKENALYGLLLITLVNVTLDERTIRRRALPVASGVVAGLILLARMTPMSLAVVALQPLLASRRGARASFGLQYVISAALAIVPWVAYAMWAFGSPLPTSARVKTAHMWDYVASGPALPAMSRAIASYVGACGRFALGLESHFWPAPHEYDQIGRLLVPLLVATGLVRLVGVAIRHCRAGSPQTQPAASLLALLSAVLVATTTLAIAQAQDPDDMYYRRWYIVELPIFTAILAGIGTEAMMSAAGRFQRALRAAGVVVLALWLAGAARDTIGLGKPSPTYVDLGRWQDVVLRATLWTNREFALTRADRVGAFTAGLLAWFSNGTVVNLDGLANDEIALRLSTDSSIDRYCGARGIHFYVDAVDPAEMFEKYKTWIVFPNPQSHEFSRYYVAEIETPRR